ncbi:glycosyltransferase family 22 protein [Backusella circina FSU 941]|nr:glycosyltransferase family 22 protein [Backusella circina FSU 941]
MIRYLAFAGAVFRFEVGILLVILLLSEWITGHISLSTILVQTLVTVTISLILTVPLDSYLWGRWIWPEAMVFYFNAILNKSSEWGTMPFQTYFTSFLPRILIVSYPLSIWAYITDNRVRSMLTPVLIYILMFSCLPHKEWRFIVYTIPIFTAAAASTVSLAITASRRSIASRCFLLVILGSAVLSFAASVVMFQVSRLNYPGGEALASLHQIAANRTDVYVHLDVETAMTGASRFGQSNANWLYSKDETHKVQDDYIEAQYTHVITANPDMFDKNLFRIIDETYGLERVKIKSPMDFLESVKSPASVMDIIPLEYKMVPKLYTLELVDPNSTWIKHAIESNHLVMYSKTYCPYCRGAKQLLSKYCPSYKVVEVNLERDGGRSTQQALFKLTGQYTFPNIFIDGKSVGGFDNLSELDRQGGLNNICKQ